MTFKKILSFALAVLLIFGSVFAVSAETPPYSQDFASKDEMLDSLDNFIESYPFVEGYYFQKAIPTGYHLELKEVVIPQLAIGDYVPESYSYAESNFRQGVDYTFTSYGLGGTSNALRFLVYYGLNGEEIQKRLDVDGATKDEVQGHINYCAIESESTEGITRCEYRIAAWDKLIVAYSSQPYDEAFYHNLFLEETGLYLPVRVKDSVQWFEETLEKCHIIGDVNADEKLNIRDATALQKYCAKLDEVYKLVADFNGDLKINVKDATDIQKKLAGLDYTCRRELYPVTFSHRNNTEEKLVEATTDYVGPFTDSELSLIVNYDVPDVSNYTTVFNSTQEFEAFFGTTLDKYDDEFFENNSLVYLYRWYSSSSQMIYPDSLQYLNGVLHIFCSYDQPGAGEGWQDALGNYNLYFEVSKSDIEGLKGIKVSEVMVVYD